MAKKGGKRSGGGGGSKQRKYTRDNNGRFASTGTGATARGGRLKTAAGNKRKTQTMQSSAALKGTIGKPKGLKPGTIKPKVAAKPAAAPKQSSRRRRPTADESRAKGLTPISDIRARQAAAGAARDASRTRRVQSNMTRARGQQVASTQGNQRAPFGRYSTIKNPAAEGSFPQMAPGRSGLGMSQAAKGRASTAPKPAAKPKGRIRATKRIPFEPNSAQANKIGSLKGDTEVFKQRIAVQQKIAKETTSKTGKLAAKNEISGFKQSIRGNTNSITKLEAKPIYGKRVVGRGDGPAKGPKAKRPNAIRGKVKRDTTLKAGPTTNAARYPNIYRDSANTKGKAAAKAAAAASKPAAKSKGKTKIDDAKAERVVGRLNKVINNSKTGVKGLNATQVGERAKEFLTRKAGGVAMFNERTQKLGKAAALESVRQSMTKPTRYSTQTPNRNKPRRFNALGQDQKRAKAKLDAMTGRERIAKSNEARAAKTKKSSGKKPAGALSRRALPEASAPKAPGYVTGRRQAGTMARPKPASKPVSSTVSRTIAQSKTSQRYRREQILNSTRTGFLAGKVKRNPRLKRSDTGMKQLSLIGQAKTLYRYKRVKPR